MMNWLSRSKVGLVFGSIVLLSGCADYMNHRDRVTFAGGNATEANAAIHSEQPWPRSAPKTTIYTEGNRLPAGQRKKKSAKK